MQISYRRLDSSHEPQFGGGMNDYLTDFDAVAQAIETRLLLFEGEWWEDTTDGLPLWQQILGVGGAGRNLPAINLVIQRRILGTPYTQSIRNLQSSYDATTRKINFYCEVETQFGVVPITNLPMPASPGSLV